MLAERKILIVDDNPVVRAALGTYFEHTAQMKVCGEAADGLEAIQTAKQEKPDLVLMDISMPNMNGIEAASVIRSEVPNARIVVFTMFSEEVGDSLKKAAGIDLVVAKTQGVRSLMQSIDDFLSSTAEDEAQHN